MLRVTVKIAPRTLSQATQRAVVVFPKRYLSDANKTTGGSIKDVVSGVATSIKEAMGYGDTFKEELKQPYVRNMQHPEQEPTPMSNDPNKLDTFERPMYDPLTPENMRQDMPPRAKQAKEWTDEKLEKSKQWIQDSKEKVKESTKSMKEQIKESVSGAASSAGQILKDAREKIDDFKVNNEEKPYEAQVFGKQEAIKKAEQKMAEEGQEPKVNRENWNEKIKYSQEAAMNPQEHDKGATNFSAEEKNNIADAVKRTKYARSTAKDSFIAAKQQSNQQEKKNQSNKDLAKDMLANDEPELKAAEKANLNDPDILQNQKVQENLQKQNYSQRNPSKQNLKDLHKDQKMKEQNFEHKNPDTHNLNPTQTVVTEQKRGNQGDKFAPKPDESYSDPILRDSKRKP